MKAIVAQCLASVLRWNISEISEEFEPEKIGQEKMFDLELYRLRVDDEKKSKKKSEIEGDQFLSYIVKAIKYAAGEIV